MEEKSLEEVMSDLSVTTASTGPDTEEIKVAPVSFLEDPISTISQSPVEEQKLTSEEVKQEVADMVEEQHNDFYNQHIEEDMSSLEKQYVNMERSAAIIDAKIIKLKQDNAEIFNKLAELEKQKEEALANKDDYREVIAHKLAIIGEKKWKGMEVEFTYYAPSFKESFNKKRFEKEQPNMYAKYLDKTPVKEYIKQKLSLLPILPEDLEEDK